MRYETLENKHFKTGKKNTFMVSIYYSKIREGYVNIIISINYSGIYAQKIDHNE
jgi:hypothetical protein